MDNFAHLVNNCSDYISHTVSDDWGVNIHAGDFGSKKVSPTSHCLSQICLYCCCLPITSYPSPNNNDTDISLKLNRSSQ